MNNKLNLSDERVAQSSVFVPEAPSLSYLDYLSQQAPFSALLEYLQKLFCIQYFDMDLGPELLGKIQALRNTPKELENHFISQTEFETDARYYEEIIFQDKKIPTRANWHDFFNGLIWLQFPRTKHYFTKVHNSEIHSHGLKRRTPVRDRITHFDECGLLLLSNHSDLENEIAAHNWQHVFVEKKAAWHRTIVPVIIGHALWEMLLNPFIGLTAKVKVLYLPNASDAELAHIQASLYSTSISAKIDDLLYQHLNENQDLYRHKPWLPLPLLGIPRWSHLKQDTAFYANDQYFMPKRKA